MYLMWNVDFCGCDFIFYFSHYFHWCIKFWQKNVYTLILDLLEIYYTQADEIELKLSADG